MGHQLLMGGGVCYIARYSSLFKIFFSPSWSSMALHKLRGTIKSISLLHLSVIIPNWWDKYTIQYQWIIDMLHNQYHRSTSQYIKPHTKHSLLGNSSLRTILIALVFFHSLCQLILESISSAVHLTMIRRVFTHEPIMGLTHGTYVQ